MPAIQFRVVGTRPLMVHSTQIMNIGHPLRPALNAAQKRVSGRNAANPGEDNEWALMQIKFILSLYHDTTIGPYLPADNLFASIIQGGTPTREGSLIARDVSMMGDDRLPLEYEGPRDLDGLWGNGRSQFVDIRPVVIGKAKVLGCRAIFPEWAVSGSLAFIGGQKLDQQSVLRAMAVGGRSFGVGAYRRRFGRFKVMVDGQEVGADGILGSGA